MLRELCSHFSHFAPPAATFAVTALLLVVVCTFGPLPIQVGYLGILIAIVLAMLVARAGDSRSEHPEAFRDPLLLAKDEDFFELYRHATGALKTISLNKDPIYRNLAIHRSTELAGQLSAMAEGQFMFLGTETWRMVYAQLLRSPGLHLYRSVAYVKTATYWQDQPGRHSMQINLQMIDKEQLSIERIAIIPEHLWPTGERVPVEPVNGWICEQHTHGVTIKLVRQSTLANEPDLVVDLGIYGNRAVGIQELDDQGRTVRFTLSFDFVDVLAAEQRWERLSVYATPYRELLE